MAANQAIQHDVGPSALGTCVPIAATVGITAFSLYSFFQLTKGDRDKDEQGQQSGTGVSG